MNFTESFEQFSSKLTTMDLALYAGVGLVLWVLFKDKLSPVQEFLLSVINKVKGSSTVKSPDQLVPVVVPVVSEITPPKVSEQDTFFKLVVSWKQTRDLAVQSGCSEAVKVADQMFPFLSPNVCGKKDVV
jgi:hypothetical protein